MGKHAWLLKDEDVARWLRNIGRGSIITAEVSLRRLGKACELLDTTPKEMVAKAKKKPKALQDELEDLVAKMEDQGKAPQYIVGILKVIKSWLSYNDITLSMRIKIRNPSSTPSIENEQVPSQDELARIFRNSSSRVRAAEVLMAFADLRPETLGNHHGTDGLKVGDLPEMLIVDKQVQFAKVPRVHRGESFLVFQQCWTYRRSTH